jgi:hypothetical protein
MKSVAEQVFERLPHIFEMVLDNLTPVDRISFCYTFGKEEYLDKEDDIFMLMLEVIKNTDQILLRYQRNTAVLKKNLSVRRKWMDEEEERQKKRKF